MRVEIFTMTTCPYCIRAKKILNERGIPFRENVIEYDDDEAWNLLEKRTGVDTVPQIFVDGVFFGVYDDLESLDRKDKLESLKNHP